MTISQTQLDLDDTKIAREVRAAKEARRLISDACARVIASQWYSEKAGTAFVDRGLIGCRPDTLWARLFQPEYDQGAMLAADREAADALRAYLQNAGGRGPVRGWGDLWL